MNDKTIRIMIRMVCGVALVGLLLYFNYDQWDNVKDVRTMFLYFLLMGGTEGLAEFGQRILRTDIPEVSKRLLREDQE